MIYHIKRWRLEEIMASYNKLLTEWNGCIAFINQRIALVSERRKFHEEYLSQYVDYAVKNALSTVPGIGKITEQNIVQICNNNIYRSCLMLEVEEE